MGWGRWRVGGDEEDAEERIDSWSCSMRLVGEAAADDGDAAVAVVLPSG
jgi:hypothetical protein